MRAMKLSEGELNADLKWCSIEKPVPTGWGGRGSRTAQHTTWPQHKESGPRHKESLSQLKPHAQAIAAQIGVAAQAIVDGCRECALSLASGESCTGGMIASTITDCEDAGQMIEQSFVAYSSRAKEELLYVPADLIRKCGVVSAEVARAMARGAMERAGTDIGIGTTGILGEKEGPGGEPAGLVFIAVVARADTRGQGAEKTRELRLGPQPRAEGREVVVLAGLKLLHEVMMQTQSGTKKKKLSSEFS